MSTEQTSAENGILYSKAADFRERIRQARLIARPSPHTSGWYCRYFVRHFSIYFSYFFARWGVPANAITCAMFVAGLGGSACMLPRNLALNIAGALLWQLEYIFDCIDGEVARLGGGASKLGKYLDYVSHIIVNPTVILSLGIHISLQEPSTLNIAVTIVAYSAWQWKRQLHQLGPLIAEKQTQEHLHTAPGTTKGRSAKSMVRVVLVTSFGDLAVILVVSAIILLSHLFGLGIAKWGLYLYTPALLFYTGAYLLRDVHQVRQIDKRERQSLRS